MLVIVALALPAAHAGAAPAATGPRERAALIELFATDAALARARQGAQAARPASRACAATCAACVRARRSPGRISVSRSAHSRSASTRSTARIRSTRSASCSAARSWSRDQRGPRSARSPLALGQRARALGAPLARGAAGQSRTLRTAEAGARRRQAAWEARVGRAPACRPGAAGAARAAAARARARPEGAGGDGAPRRQRARHDRPAAAARRRRSRDRAVAAACGAGALGAVRRRSSPARRSRSRRPPIRSPGTRPAACPSARASAPRIPASSRWERASTCRATGAAWPPTRAARWSEGRSTSGCRARRRPCTGARPLPSRSDDAGTTAATLLVTLAALTVLVPVPAAAAQNGVQDAALARGISKALASHGLGGHGTGVAVADLATGEVIYRRNGWRPLLPASTEKLFTTVGALSDAAARLPLRDDGRWRRDARGRDLERRPLPRRLGRPDVLDRRCRRARSPDPGPRHRAGQRAHPRRRDDLRRVALRPLARALHRRRVAAALGSRARPRRRRERP